MAFRFIWLFLFFVFQLSWPADAHYYCMCIPGMNRGLVGCSSLTSSIVRLIDEFKRLFLGCLLVGLVLIYSQRLLIFCCYFSCEGKKNKRFWVSMEKWENRNETIGRYVKQLTGAVCEWMQILKKGQWKRVAQMGHMIDGANLSSVWRGKPNVNNIENKSSLAMKNLFFFLDRIYPSTDDGLISPLSCFRFYLLFPLFSRSFLHAHFFCLWSFQ